MSGYQETHNGNYPSAVHSIGTHGASTWVTELLPYLDAQSVRDHLDYANPANTQLPVLQCPTDSENTNTVRGLSYVVNVGYGLLTPACMTKRPTACTPATHWDTIEFGGSSATGYVDVTGCENATGLDGLSMGLISVIVSTGSDTLGFGVDWNQDGIVTSYENNVTSGTGVFWSHDQARNPTFHSRRLESGDGYTNTMMLSERHVKRDWFRPSALLPSNAAASFYRLRFMTYVTSHGFGMGMASFRHASAQHVMPISGPPWVSQPRGRELSFDRIMTTDNPLACQGDPNGNTTKIINTTSSFYMAPMSAHRGGVNVAFCDGRVTFMSDDVSPSVFAQLITSAGSDHGQGILGDDAF